MCEQNIWLCKTKKIFFLEPESFYRSNNLHFRKVISFTSLEILNNFHKSWYITLLFWVPNFNITTPFLFNEFFYQLKQPKNF